MKKLCCFLLTLILMAVLPGCQTAGTEPAGADARASGTPQQTAADETPDVSAPVPEPESEVRAPVTRILIFDTAAKTLSASEQPRRDDSVSAYSVAELCRAYEIAEAEQVTVIGSNGFQQDEPFSSFLEKSISLTAEHAPIVVGETQDADWAVWNMSAVCIGTTAVVFSYQEADIRFADLFALVGMQGADTYAFGCNDGYTQIVPSEEIEGSSLARIDGRIDAKLPSLGEYTLYNVLSIEPNEPIHTTEEN